MHRVFISYAHEDSSRANGLKEALENDRFEVVMDKTDVQVTDPLRERLKDLVSTSEAMVLVLSEHSAKSGYVKYEFNEARKKNVPVVPLVVGDLSQWPDWYEALHNTPYVPAAANVTSRVRRRVVVMVRAVAKRAKIVSFFNMKGGVGKTTLAAQVAARLAKGSDAGRRPYSTLVVDLDPQQSLTEQFVSSDLLLEYQQHNRSIVGLCEPVRLGQPRREGDYSVNLAPVLPPPDYSLARIPLGTGEAKTSNPCEFDIVPGDFEAIRYSDEPGVDRNLLVHNFMRAMESFRGKYDLIVLDCNPSVSPLTHCALRADHIVIPVTPDEFGRRGFLFVNRFLERHFPDEEQRPVQHAVLNKVYQSKKPKQQQPFLEALARGLDEFGPGMKDLSEIVLEEQIPLERDLAIRTVQIESQGVVNAHSYVEGMQRADPVIERLVDQLVGRVTNPEL